MENSPKARIVRVPVQVEENKFIRDSIDRNNMKLTSKYDALDQKSKELSEAAREIEEFLRQEQKREHQKKRNRNILE